MIYSNVQIKCMHALFLKTLGILFSSTVYIAHLTIDILKEALYERSIALHSVLIVRKFETKMQDHVPHRDLKHTETDR